jgi:hypothetical protein
MAPEELQGFYEAALTAGAILSGFNGTFMAFRIQREANYYRQPVLDFQEAQGKDVWLGLSRFNSSLLLIILGTLCSMIFGVFWPLAALAHCHLFMSGPAPILAGIVASGTLVAAYFLDEIIHYEILKLSWPGFRSDLRSWRREWWIVVVGILLAIVSFGFIFLAVGP